MRRFHYKPRVTLTVNPPHPVDPGGGCRLSLRAKLPDSRWRPPERDRFPVGMMGDILFSREVTARYHYGEPAIPTVMIGQTWSLPAWPGESRAAEELRAACRRFEEHELDEWATVDGIRLWDPHLSAAERSAAKARLFERPGPR